MKALVTGILGFAGSHLCEHLLAEGWEVEGTRLHSEPYFLPPEAASRVILYNCDLRERAACWQVVEKSHPDVIFHLAAVAFVPRARIQPALAFDTNVLGTVNFLEAVHRHRPDCAVVFISSGEVYGRLAAENVPTSEDAPVRPASYYAATKVAAETMAAAYCREFGLRVIILRPFSHIGPRQSPDFVTSSFARQIAQIEKGIAAPVLSVGNLEAKRDFTDVRDMVRAYRLAASFCQPGVPYNVASGSTWAIREVLDVFLSMSRVRVQVRQDPERLRPSDTPIFRGDATRFRQCTRWSPTIPLEQSLRDILDYWRQRV